MKLYLREITEIEREHHFSIPAEEISARANSVCEQVGGSAVKPPEYRFVSDPVAAVKLSMRRDTVFFSGAWTARVVSPCSRCANELTIPLAGSCSLVLKPVSASGDPEVAFDDIDFGYYREDFINCGDLIEEDIMRQIPYAVSCEEYGTAACDKAVVDYLNSANSADEEVGDERMAIFRTLKVS